MSVFRANFYRAQTGGVTLTLGLAYLAVHNHQRNREQQSQALRSQARALNSLIEPVVAPPPPTRAEIEAARHANLVDSAKERWNAEVVNAARWAQHTDWVEVREDLQDGLSRAWRGVFGGPPEAQVEEARRKASAAKEELAREAKEAKGAWERAREKALSAAEERAAEAKAAVESRAAEAKRVLDAEAAEVRRTAKEEGESAKQEGRGLFQRAKEAVGVVEDKASEKARQVKDQAETLLTTGTTSPVERALQQRYEKKTSLDKSVEEVLSERYLPTAAKDSTQLRGI